MGELGLTRLAFGQRGFSLQGFRVGLYMCRTCIFLTIREKLCPFL